MAEVYWIHLPEHTDMFTEGYIGVTRNTAKARYDQHCRAVNSKKGRGSIISRAIVKYGKNGLIAETIVICDIGYAADLESKLRPKDGIGWNIVKGGGLPPINKRAGKKMPEGFGETISKALLGRKDSEQTKRNKSLAQMGRKHSEESKNKMRASKSLISPWLRSGVKVEIWRDAEIYFYNFKNGLSVYHCEKKFNLWKGALEGIYKHFKNGWNPFEDQLWLNEFKNKEADYAPQST